MNIIDDLETDYSKVVKERLTELPPLPEVASKALELVSSEDVDLSEVSELIIKDQVISAKIIEYANAAYHALPNPITDIKKAVLSLGLNEVKDILIKVITSEIIYKLLCKSLTEIHRKIAMHSYLSAILAESICGIAYPQNKAKAFLCALLHDIGKLLIMTTFPEEFKIITNNAEELRTLDKEQQTFTLDHCLVGKWIAEKWNLPKDILHAIWLHHQSLDTINELQFVEDKKVLFCVMLANFYSHVKLVDSQSIYADQEEIECLFRTLGLKADDLNSIFLKSIETLTQTGSIFEIEKDSKEIYVSALQRAINQLYKLAKTRDVLVKKEQEVSKLKALLRFAALLPENKTLASTLKNSVSFFKRVLQPTEGLVFLIVFLKKKVYLAFFNEKFEFNEYTLDQFFERNQHLVAKQEFLDILRDLINRFLTTNEPEKGIMFKQKDKILIINVRLSEMQKCLLGFLLKDIPTNIRDDREFLSYIAYIIKNTVDGLSVYEESKKMSESLAVALSKNNEMLNALKKAKRDFENLFKFSNDPVAIHLSNGVIKRVNSRFEEVIGYPENEVVDKNLFELMELPGRLRQAEICTLWLDDKGHVFEASIEKKGGNKIPVQVSSRVVSREEGIIQSIIRDLSAEKQAAEKIRLEKERLLVTLSSLGDGVIATDQNGMITLMNKTAENITGYSFAEVSSKSLTSIFKTVTEKGEVDFLDSFLEILRSKEKKSVTRLGNLIDKNGQTHPITYTLSPIVDSEGKLKGMVVVFSDLTERMQLEEELFRVKKFESLALLSGGIAHDFNNILTAISGNISIAKMNITKPEKAKEKLTIAEKAIERAKELTHQLFSFSKSGTVAIKKPVDIGELIKEAVNLGTCGSAILCELMIEERLWPVECDAGQISQVLNNLIINAKEAMTEGGRLRVRAKNEVVIAGQIPSLSPGRYVLIEVQDEGPGIPKDILDKIFDPYFTTKSRGSGLGLSTVWNIVRRHGGIVLVSSEVEKGSVFSVYLPASGTRPERVPEGEVAPLVRGQGNVLVMDDEEDLRQVAKEIFETLGYTVFLAENGEEALRTLESGERFQLVVLDLTVRGGSGALSVLSQVKARPNVGFVVVSTGYAADEVISNYKEFGFDAAIAKPYDISKISEMIKSLKDD